MGPTIVLSISFTPGKPPQVTGPINDKILCYGLLEIAKDMIRDYKPDAIQVPTAAEELRQLLAQQRAKV